MAVANTYTLEYEFGSHIVVRGAGFLLNNQMSDFNWHPGVTDRHGAIGTPANVIAPGKRMLSSQSPTVVARDGRAVLVTGSPGGRTIINTVLSVVLGVLEYGLPLDEAVAAATDASTLVSRRGGDGEVGRPALRRADRGAGADGASRRAAQAAAGRCRIPSWCATGPIGAPPDRRISGYAAGY